MVDVCVIGAGPVGAASALRFAELGLRVILLESGSEAEAADVQSLSNAEIATPETHSSMEVAVCRGFGGTSRWWGGRCVPLDPIDFEVREAVPHSGWPLSFDELEPFYTRACEFLRAGHPRFSVDLLSAERRHFSPMSEQMPFSSGPLISTTLERWSTRPSLGDKVMKAKLKRAGVELLLGITCVGFIQPTSQAPVRSARCRWTDGSGEPFEITARAFVLAAGGIESTRLALNSAMDQGLKLDGVAHVGSFYMGHPSGKIALITLKGDARKTLYGFERDGATYVRRRLTIAPAALRSNGLLNIAFWFDNPSLRDPSHESGVLSAAYLALHSPIGPLLAPAAVRSRVVGDRPENVGRHLWNCLRRPMSTGFESLDFLHKRLIARPRIPGFHVRSGANVYALHFHAEQAPGQESSISLLESRDRLGLRKASVKLRWSDKDVESVVKAHEILDDGLRQCAAGELKYIYPRTELENQVREQGFDGYHQIGTLRMGADPASSVTDRFGRFWGTPNCYVAGSAAFPTSGQANPTLAAVALAFRQAEHVAHALKAAV